AAGLARDHLERCRSGSLHRTGALSAPDAVPDLVRGEPGEGSECEVPLPVHLASQRIEAGPREQGLVEVEERRFHGRGARVYRSSHRGVAPRRCATTPDRIERAISSAVRAPMSTPTGVRIRARSSSVKPCSRSCWRWGPTWRVLPITPTNPVSDLR